MQNKSETNDLHDAQIEMLRLPATLGIYGKGRSSFYSDIEDGVWTPGVKIGDRAVAWPKHEALAIIRARIAGASKTEIRSLVNKLLADRRKAYQRKGDL